MTLKTTSLMFKRIRLITTALMASVSCLPSLAQLSNGSFENAVQNPHYQQKGNTPNSIAWHQATFATGWYSPNGGSPDLFDDGETNSAACGNPNDISDNPGYPALGNDPATPPLCCYPQVCCSQNTWGSQFTRDQTNDPIWGAQQYNNRFAGFAAGSEYIQTQFTQLTAGVTYEVRFWVSRADLSANCARLQILLSHNSMNAPYSFGPMSYSSDPDAYVLTCPYFAVTKTDWLELVFSFTSTGTERFLTIGVFDVNGIINSQGQPEALFAPSSAVGDCGDVNSGNPCGGVQPSSIAYGNNQTVNCPSPGAYCQIGSATVYYYIDDVSLRPTCTGFPLPVVYNDQTITPANGASNTNILLTGNITVNGSVNFSGCTIRCNPGTSITIPAGSHLILNNGTVLSGGCNNLMWFGIRVNNGGSLTINSATIEDAMLGIDCNAGFLSINRGTFRKNVDCIKWQNPTATSGQFIRSSTFDMVPPLVDATQGVNGHSRFGVRYINASLTTPMQFGGAGFGQGCVFIGGLYAIVADRASLNVINCNFSQTVQTAIDFRGDITFSSIKDLKVTGCTFNDGKNHVKSYFKSNLTIESSTFSDASEHSVLWFYNPDCHLKIGDEGDATKGNVFNNNGWTAVVTSGNATAQTNITPLSNPSNTTYSTLIISNNKVNGPPWATGFLVTENVLGSNLTYQQLSITNNVLSGLNEGILVTNIRGWGSFYSELTAPQGLPTTWIHKNQILASTVINATATCIKVDNAPGLNISQNGMDSDNNQDWQNTGLRIDNSENSEIADNITGAGRGIIAAGSMMWSNIHCNTMVGNEAGIVLGYCALRPDASLTHGFRDFPNDPGESYTNNFVLMPPYHADIHNWYSDLDKNQWVWSSTVTPSYPIVWYDGVNGGPNQSGLNSSIIYPFIGAFVCGGFPYRLAFTPENVSPVSADPDLQWRYDYNYQVVKNNTNMGSSNYSSQNIKRIIKIENGINSGNYAMAIAQMNGFSPSNLIEQNYKTVLQIMLDISSPTRRELNANEVATLTQIAEQNPRTSGTAVTLARGILRVQLNLKFKDEEFVTEDRVKGTAFIQSPCCLAPASGTQLVFADQLGNVLPIAPALVDQNGNFSFDPYQLNYYNDLFPGTLFRIAAADGSKFTVLNKDFKILSDWITASPIEIILGGAKEDYVTTSNLLNTSVVASTIAVDGGGNTYTVGTVSSPSGSDFLVEKRNPSGSVLWTKNYHGHHAAGNDSATCTTFGADGHLYVAGKVWNGSAYNFATVKYDTTGFMQWEIVLEDSVFNDAPIAIGFYSSDTSVIVTGSCTNSSSAHYKTVKYKQCVTGPSSSRLGQPAQPQIGITKSVNYYPNPNSGSITIDTKGVGCTITLFNVNGQEVWSKGNLSNGVVEFPENQVPDGVYLCKFTMTDGQTQFEKLIIQRN
jgi:hypothetical protein